MNPNRKKKTALRAEANRELFAVSAVAPPPPVVVGPASRAGKLVDEIGTLKAQLAPQLLSIETKSRELKKAHGDGRVVGALFEGVITTYPTSHLDREKTLALLRQLGANDAQIGTCVVPGTKQDLRIYPRSGKAPEREPQ